VRQSEFVANQDEISAGMSTWLLPLLLRMDPERAHNVAALWMRAVARCGGPPGHWTYRSARLRQEVAGLRFENPLGVAAGLDKTGALYPFLSRAGFGFVESGTFTAQRQSGNPKPRLFRFPAERALVNRMGFNNPGAASAARRLARHERRVPRGVSLGKSRVAPLEEAAQDQAAAARWLAPQADYLAINVSSPNTPGLRTLQTTQALEPIVVAVREAAGVLPIFLKLSPDLEPAPFDELVAAALEWRLAGLVLTNTTTQKNGVPGAASVEGGLSGAPLRERSTQWIRRAFGVSGGKLVLIGAGGIFSGEDALEKIRAGASLVQLYTGYVFGGPLLPARINRVLDQACLERGCKLERWIGDEHR
jgi:dihydroorotate dehydrogenase